MTCLKRKGVNKMIKGLSNFINILNYNYDNLNFTG